MILYLLAGLVAAPLIMRWCARRAGGWKAVHTQRRAHPVSWWFAVFSIWVLWPLFGVVIVIEQFGLDLGI